MSEDNRTSYLSEPIHQPRITGRGNVVTIGARCHLECVIEINGDCNTIEVGHCVYFGPGYIGIKADHARIVIGSHTTFGGGAISAHETGEVIIGEDCMISTEQFMDCRDMHPIVDVETGERLNPASNILIGNHVWIGYRAIVTKGSTLGDGAVVAAGSLVRGEVAPQTVVGSNPARVLRSGVRWERNFPG